MLLGIGYSEGMEQSPTPKFVITHPDLWGRRDIVRLPEGTACISKSMSDDVYRAICAGWLHMAGSAYCVHLSRTGRENDFGICRKADSDEVVFTREMMRDVRTEISKRDPQWNGVPPDGPVA